jgi:hypothetical protein
MDESREGAVDAAHGTGRERSGLRDLPFAASHELFAQ